MPSARKAGQLAVIGSMDGLKSMTVKMKEHAGMVVPRGVNPDRLVKMALIAATKEPKLLECTQQSMMLALMSAAELGLDPSGSLGHGWIVPFYNSKERVQEAVFIPGWKGLLQLVFKSGKVDSVMADAIYAEDECVYRTMPPVLEHTRAPRPTPERRVFVDGYEWKEGKLVNPGHLAGTLVATYCSWTVRGARSFYRMEADDIETIRLSCKAPVSPAWRDWTEAMCIKSAIRAAVAFMPMSAEEQQSFAMATANEDEKLGLRPFIDLPVNAPSDESGVAGSAEAGDAGTPSEGGSGVTSPEEGGV